MFSIIKPAMLACAIAASPADPQVCQRQTVLMPGLILGAFCLEEHQMCCNSSVCTSKFALACYPNKIFVGNMESLIR